MENNNIKSSIPKDLESILGVLAEKNQDVNENEEKIHATSVGGATSFVYEKIRNVVEYRDQNLFRKNAIKRYLMRNIKSDQGQSKLAENLVTELIKTRYIKNDTLPKLIIKDVDTLIDKYVTLGVEINKNYQKRTRDLPDEIVGMLAVAIERVLVPRDAEEKYLEYVYDIFRTHTNLSDLDEKDKASFLISLYTGVQRSLLKSDLEIIKFYLFNSTYPSWKNSDEKIFECAKDYKRFNKIIGAGIGGGLALRTLKVVRKNIAPYIVIKNLLFSENISLDKNLEWPRLSRLIDDECEDLYKKMKTNLINSIIRSIIFLFITKMLIALAVEIPYNRLVLNNNESLPLLINLLFPPIYLLIIGLTVKIPKLSNTEKIKNVINNIFYKEGKDLEYIFKSKVNLSENLLLFFNSLYLIVFGLTVLLIVWVMLMLEFTIVDGVVFFIFLSTVSFFGNRIKNFNREMIIGDVKRGMFSSFWDFLYSPFMRIGQWLSDTYSKINVFTFILDFIIEAPLKSIINIADHWVSFMKEKNEDLY